MHPKTSTGSKKSASQRKNQHFQVPIRSGIVKHFIMSLWLRWLHKHSLCLTLNLHFIFFFTQSGKNYAINCVIQAVHLIWRQKIWLAICEFLWSLTNQNAWFFTSFCTELTIFCTLFTRKNCTTLNPSEWRNFFMYIIGYQSSWKSRVKLPPNAIWATDDMTRDFE